MSDRLKYLAGILTEERKIEYLKRMHRKIGDHDVFVNNVYRSGTMGSNPMATLEIGGKRYEAYKQGMIGIWAFPGRDMFSREEQRELDSYLNDAFEEMTADMKEGYKPKTQAALDDIEKCVKNAVDAMLGEPGFDNTMAHDMVGDHVEKVLKKAGIK